MDLVGERLSRSSAALIKTLYNQMYSYAEANDLCDKNYALYVKMNTADDTEHGIPFSESDLRKLWQHKSDPIVEFLLIMCYSGYRISAYRTLEVHLNEKYFKGGVKTAAGKERVVPIHSAILPLVRRRVKEQGKILTITPERFRDKMYDTLDDHVFICLKKPVVDRFSGLFVSTVGAIRMYVRFSNLLTNVR